MTSRGGSQYYWCLQHHRVEADDDKCASIYLLGPFDNEAEAREALATVAERNVAWDAEDARWSGDTS